MASTTDRQRYSPAWVAALGAIATAGVTVAVTLRVVPMPWIGLPIGGLIATVVAFLGTAMQAASSGVTGWARVGAYRIVVAWAMAAWATWVALAGWAPLRVGILVAGTAALAILGHLCPNPLPDALPMLPAAPVEAPDRRHPVMRDWEARIRQVFRQPVVVDDWRPWDNPDDGLRLYVSLPPETGTTVADLAAVADKLAAAARLPRGCAVRVQDAEHQGTAVVDVMLRNALADPRPPYREPTTPASINHEFPVLTTPRGERLSICLRIFSMVVGGTVGSGKTTLLHRLIAWLARCVDALIWVVDLNGGGLAEPWILPWAQGRATAPVVDWVADSEEEAALMVAVAAEIARDRKTNRAAVGRKRDANTMVLPVDRHMPAIVLLTDEGGEVRQAVSLLGQLAAAGITRLAQIGRAEGLRVVISVLRGTSDLTDKGLRVNAALRLCLRMEENDEYWHVLGRNPGRVELDGTPGGGFLRTPQVPNPVLGSTVNLDLAGIDTHAVACGPMRPVLDEHALRVAARVNPNRVLGGREPTVEHLRLPQMRDAVAGLAYTGRWHRYAAKLAEMRGEEYTEPDEPTAVAPPRVSGTPALDAWTASVNRTTTPPAPTATIYPFPTPARPAEDAVAREQVIALVAAAGEDGIRATDIKRGVTVGHSRVYVVIGELLGAGAIVKTASGLYVLPARAEVN